MARFHFFRGFFSHTQGPGPGVPATQLGAPFFRPFHKGLDYNVEDPE
jgi:hypothetical protein